MAITRKTYVEIVKILGEAGIKPEESINVAETICKLVESESQEKFAAHSGAGVGSVVGGGGLNKPKQDGVVIGGQFVPTARKITSDQPLP